MEWKEERAWDLSGEYFIDTHLDDAHGTPIRRLSVQIDRLGVDIERLRWIRTYSGGNGAPELHRQYQFIDNQLRMAYSRGGHEPVSLEEGVAELTDEFLDLAQGMGLIREKALDSIMICFGRLVDGEYHPARCDSDMLLRLPVPLGILLQN
jgi:hypothetical protein